MTLLDRLKELKGPSREVEARRQQDIAALPHFICIALLTALEHGKI